MSHIKSTLNRFYWTLLGLIFTSSVLAAEQAPVQPYPGPWWHGTHMPFFGWIFPIMFFVMIILMFIFMTRRGGMGCMRHDSMMVYAA
jgi:uncharacterized membrane protein